MTDHLDEIAGDGCPKCGSESISPVKYTWWGGLIAMPSVLMAAFGLPLMLAGGWLGTSLFRRYGQTAYRPTAVIALGLTAVATLARGAAGLLH